MNVSQVVQPRWCDFNFSHCLRVHLLPRPGTRSQNGPWTAISPPRQSPFRDLPGHHPAGVGSRPSPFVVGTAACLFIGPGSGSCAPQGRDHHARGSGFRLGHADDLRAHGDRGGIDHRVGRADHRGGSPNVGSASELRATCGGSDLAVHRDWCVSMGTARGDESHAEFRFGHTGGVTLPPLYGRS